MIRTESDIDERNFPVGDPRTPATLASTLAHLTRLDLLLRREVLRFRQQQPQARDEGLRGLYVSDDDVDEILTRSLTAVGLLAPGTDSTRNGRLRQRACRGGCPDRRDERARVREVTRFDWTT